MKGLRDGAGGVIAGGVPALVPPGKYQLGFDGWETRMHLGRSAKVVLYLRICDLGPLMGTKLERWYNARRLVGPPKASGGFAAGWSSDLVREYASIAGLPNRSDRIPLCRYGKLLLVGDVETVTTDRNQRALPASLQYSVVRRLALGHT